MMATLTGLVRLTMGQERDLNSIDLIRDNLIKSRDRVLSRIEEMQDHCLVFPTPNSNKRLRRC